MKTITFDPTAGKESIEMLKGIVAQSPEGGYDLPQLRAALKLADRLDAATANELVLEDAEYSFLVDRIKSVRWTVANRDVANFIDAILNAS